MIHAKTQKGAKSVSVEQPCNIQIDRIDNGYLFRVVGRGTLRESPAVREFACGAIEDGVDVLMDLSRCEHLDSTFLGCLVILKQRGEGNGGSFRVYADKSVRDRLFGVSHLDRVLPFNEQLPKSAGAPVSFQVTNLKRKEFCQHLLDTHHSLAELGGPSAQTFQRIVDQLKVEVDELL